MNVFADAMAYLFDPASWRGYDGMLALLVEQLLLTLTAMLVATAVALPIALTLGHLGRGGFLAINVTNFGRAIPTFALLALFVVADPWGWTDGRFPGAGELGPYGRAGASTLVALALFALPPIVTNAYVAMREVPKEIVEAARGMGMTGRQLFLRVELPLALPLVVSGLRLALVQVWATATIAALVVGPGLGRVIVDGFDSEDYGKGIAGAVVVAVMALLLELTAALVERWVRPGDGRRAREVDGELSGAAPTVVPSASQGH
ncbi:ABC transporter permease [Nocardioides sp. cx-173]|uniref:ABC transporter permease n=1 Tax=Nocardioides sp. cx-173 TaxID=2898796 RepID=UPI001E4B5527|nr:ABC transporter permease [Nocardioides sp. cx-173]MCD4523311.1 ABC transporter permease [Nocardioides sp. cx-173]UGB42348.1 ABC transporter permease [Nocardioides sp. cx-173]